MKHICNRLKLLTAVMALTTCTRTTVAQQKQPIAVSGAADSKAYLNSLIVLLNAKWPNNRTINIVCHGHSVPAGYFKTPVVDSFNAYPHLLHKGLKERFPYAVLN